MKAHLDEKTVVGSADEHHAGVLRNLFRFKDEPAVCRYLLDNADLEPLLLQCHRKVGECFGPEVLTGLEVFSDPEGGKAKLFVVIQTSFPVEKARASLNRLDEGWWLEVPADVPARLNIDVEYV